MTRNRGPYPYVAWIEWRPLHKIQWCRTEPALLVVSNERREHVAAYQMQYYRRLVRWRAAGSPVKEQTILSGPLWNHAGLYSLALGWP